MATNVLTANQANGTEAGNTTGVVTTGAGSTVTSSTTQKKSGSRAIKCVCAGSGTGEGVKTTTTAITLPAGAVTFVAAVYASVEVDVTITGTSSSASLTATNTVTVPATTWTVIQATGVATKAFTDGVLTVKTGETQACDLYVDELGAWSGVGGDWRLPGVEIPNTGGVNSNQVDYYAGLAPISAGEKAQIALGYNDNEVDWDTTNTPQLVITRVAVSKFVHRFSVSPAVQADIAFGDVVPEYGVIPGEGTITHTYATDNHEYTATVSARGFTDGTATFSIGTP